MKKILHILTITVLAFSMLTACGSATDENDSQTASGNQETTQAEEQQTKKAAEESKEPPVDLTHTYVTKFSTEMAVTYPDFEIRYPNGWTLADHAVDTEVFSETFTLTSDSGAQIIFNHLPLNEGGGSKAVSTKAELSKAADAEFVPGFIQDTDHSGLGAFAVMKIKTTERTMYHGDGTEESETINMPDTECSYAVLPESKAGIMECNQPDMMQFSFGYGEAISIIANPPQQGGFTDRELKEAIAILQSFKVK